MKGLWFVSVCIFLINLSIRDCAPLPQNQLPSKEMEKFMKRFGYIETGQNSADALYTVEGFKAAVQQMQRFGGLPETGELDEATLNLTKAPRCGVPDVIRHQRRKRYIIGSKAWRKRRLTYFLANWPGEMDAEMTQLKLAKALKLWEDITPLRFHPKESMDADLIIAFGRSEHGDGYPFDGRGNILAHAFFPYEHGPYGGDIHFDDDEEWIDEATVGRGTDGVDFYTVAAHEIGHSLGLAHSTVPGSIMFPYYKGYDPHMRLDYDDIVAMYSLYVLDGNFEDEITPSLTTTEEPRSDGKEHNPKDDDGFRTKYNDDDDDVTIYPVSEETPRDEDIPVTKDDENSTYGFDYEYYYGFTDKMSDTEPGAKTTVVYSELPQSTESSTSATSAPTSGYKIPDLCEGSIDAASLIRGELFVFKGLYVWRLQQQNGILPGYPVYFHHFFVGFPWSIRSIDAVYQRPNDYHIIFFTGRVYWIFDGNKFTSDSPRYLSDLGLPSDLDKLDAAIVWNKNKKTYFFSGDLYWRYDEQKRAMESGYPQRMMRWKGVPSYLDTAFTWTDGRTYFFKGRQFWRFNNKNITTDVGFPLPTGSYWFGCTS